MADQFEPITILDNFYQTSSFYPMPVVLISTLSESGQTNLGPYSLVFPYIITGENQRAMMLVTRGDSNTAENIRRTKVCAINFIPDDKKFMENCVMLGFPGEATEEKMKESIFKLEPSHRNNGNPNGHYPEIVSDAVQVYECTWDDTIEPRLMENGDCFVLRVNKILLKKKYREAIVDGVSPKSFPPLPIDYGFRDNVGFWFTKSNKPYEVRMPACKDVDVNAVMYGAQRYDPSYTWTEDACAKLVKVPRIFLKKVFAGIIEAAKEEGVTTITPELVDRVRDKRNDDKNN
ncbi:MAG: hypothetical protein ACW98Y_06225 [Candidatus Thorarchaeota archaeon]|jgi:flavin reductase (DIM6/NTAB) family NADH-FMN oxidoreductase RutF